MSTDKITMMIRTDTFHPNKTPIVRCRLGFFDTSGMPASSVPEGQISLQNHGEP